METDNMRRRVIRGVDIEQKPKGIEGERPAEEEHLVKGKCLHRVSRKLVAGDYTKTS
jgi:hypothetical protein